MLFRSTVAFSDIRDEVLLEFEKRIYNNLKTDDNPIPLTVDEVVPGFFRTTDYTQSEITNILGESFLSWVGWNKLDYKAQDYLASNPFTYNYSSAGNRLDQASLLGNWRGIYRWFYDTDAPTTRPWEMLGLTEEPSWWQERYGVAPYTEGNLVIVATTDAVIPQELSDAMEVTNYLRKGGRVRTIKLRGVYSECLIIPFIYAEKLTHPKSKWSEGTDMMELLGIFKYEPPVKMIQLESGRKIRYHENPNFLVYYKFPNQKNVPEMFSSGEFVQITRKIHGTNARYGIVKKTKLSFWDKVKKFLKL